jgi:hypothetical protein
VNLQSVSWDGQGQLTNTSITFLDADFDTTTDSALAKYARCEHLQPGIALWLLQAMGAATGDTVTYSGIASVPASAVATRAPAQSSCPLPLKLVPKSGGTAANNYGFTPGEWVRLLMAPGAAAGGEIGWANLDGSNSAAQTEREMQGSCGTSVGDTLGTPGVQASIADVWNFRFGIYRNSTIASEEHPDFTGYAYTALNWPAQFNAFNGPAPGGTAENYITKRQAFASCADQGTRVRGAGSCEQITGLSLNGFQRLAAPGSTAADGHRVYGERRRIAVVPVVGNANNVIDFVCMFMLQPLTLPMSDVRLEFVGMANDPASPCTTSGLPGGSAGPLVPVLVR